MKTVLSVFAVLFLAGCASYGELGNGRYAKTALSEERSPFGTNSGFARLENCKGHKPHWYSITEYSDCQAINEWQLVSSQGQGGQIVAGAMTGIGIGVAGALMSNMNQAVTASQTVTVSSSKGHHR